MIPVSEYAIDNTSQADVDGHVVHAPSASQDEEPSEEAAKDELTSFTGAQVDHMAHSLDQLDDSSVLFWGDEAKCSDSVHEFLSQQFCEEHDNAEHSQHSSSAGVEHNGHCGTTSSPCLEPHPGDLGQCSPSIVELGHSGPEDPFAHPSTEPTSYEPGHQPSSVIVAKSHVDHGHSTLPSVSTSIERRDGGPASPPSRVYQIQGISDHRSLSNSRAGDVRDFPSLTTIQEHHHDSGHLSTPPRCLTLVPLHIAY
ncbi:hypothetical protein A0H81_01758 [Grifola frondosa]|uniref:Uncharacterized protein n=1 Tax=Grifola frondosa TaxID=5627 RepID=A0A1C7MN24_GRIFR|nr:hypothetical protein A0H81_01758 [Grifola frondosa]